MRALLVATVCLVAALFCLFHGHGFAAAFLLVIVFFAGGRACN
jgi:hypothetical protein